MGTKRTVRLAWVLCGLLTCLTVVVSGVDLLRQAGSKNGFQIAADVLFALAMPVVLGIVAALIVSRQPRNTIGWLLMVPFGSFLLDAPISQYLERLAPSVPAPTLPLLLLVWFRNWSWLLLIFPLLLIPLLFPNGQPPSPRWRWVSVAFIAGGAFVVLVTTFSEKITSDTTPALTLDNPIGVFDDDTIQAVSGVWTAVLLVLVALCVAALFTRFRRANDTEREQIKWLLSAGALFLVVFIVGAVSGFTESTSVASDIWQVCFGLSLTAFPVAIGIAILRYRLFDIDIIIRRTLVYATLTATLAAVYFSTVVLLQRVFRPLFGVENDLAIVASTLAIAALFQPLQRCVQQGIDRRFYRRKYDASRIVQAFSGCLRDEVEMDRLTNDLLGVVDEALRPAHVSLWLRQPKRREGGAARPTLAPPFNTARR